MGVSVKTSLAHFAVQVNSGWCNNMNEEDEWESRGFCGYIEYYLKQVGLIYRESSTDILILIRMFKNWGYHGYKTTSIKIYNNKNMDRK